MRDLQSVIGNEARAQMLNQTTGEMGHPTFTNGPGRLPDVVVACVGGGSNAIGERSKIRVRVRVRVRVRERSQIRTAAFPSPSSHRRVVCLGILCIVCLHPMNPLRRRPSSTL